jgi:hypothetical protein
MTALCAFCRCPRTAHTAGKGSCLAEGCDCRLFTDLTRVAPASRAFAAQMLAAHTRQESR